MEQYKYEINGKTYVQKKLVLGQVKQLQKLLKEVKFAGSVTTMDFITSIGERLSEALAIVLIPVSVEAPRRDENLSGFEPLRNKNVLELASELEDGMDLELAMQVINDFFVCNPIASILEGFNAMLEGIGKGIAKTGLTNSSSSSAAETLPKETPSNGDSPSTNANPS
jgi:hypothetical protein